MITRLVKSYITGDTTDNTTAKQLLTDFPNKIQSIALCPKHLYQSLKTTLISGREPSVPDDDPGFTALLDTEVSQLSDFVSEIYGDADVPPDAGIYLKLATYDTIGDVPAELTSFLDTDGARLSILTTHCRINPDAINSEDDFYGDIFLEYMDLRIQWLISVQARRARRDNNFAANPTLSQFLDPTLDPTLDSDYAPWCYFLKSRQTTTFEWTSFYKIEYVTLFL